jgi:hypothetical protein
MKLTAFSCSTPESVFDDFWNETHPNGTTSWDDDVDECLQDDYSEQDQE